MPADREFVVLTAPLSFLFNGAWFSAATAAMLVYWILMKDTETT